MRFEIGGGRIQCPVLNRRSCIHYYHSIPARVSKFREYVISPLPAALHLRSLRPMNLEAGVTWCLIEKMLLVCLPRARAIQQWKVHSWKSSPRTLELFPCSSSHQNVAFPSTRVNEWMHECVNACMHCLHGNNSIAFRVFRFHPIVRGVLVVAWSFFYFYFPLSDVIRSKGTSRTKEHFHARVLHFIVVVYYFSISKLQNIPMCWQKNCPVGNIESHKNISSWNHLKQDRICFF